MNNNGSQKKVSVGIVTYNSLDKVPETLRSLFAFTKGVSFEVFVYDNHSDDGTPAAVKKAFPSVHVMAGRENIGFGRANNQILRKVDSTYHLILNPDIVFKSDAVSAMVDYMDQNPEVVMTMPKLLNPDGSEQFTPKRRPSLKYMIGGRLERFGGMFRKWRSEYTRRGENLTEPTPVDFCAGCFMLARTSALKEAGGFDPRYFLYNEDADLTRTMQKKGKVMYLPQVEVVHFWSRAYMKSFRLFMVQVSSMLKYFSKWRKIEHRQRQGNDTSGARP